MTGILFIAAAALLFLSLWLIAAVLEYIEEPRTEAMTPQRKATIAIYLIGGIAGAIISAAALYYILKPVLTPINILIA
jgi:TRAP-type C4-dicarboxylate transport system permease large subunit